MVRNAEDKKDLTKVSFSFIPSLRCNLQCSFCMYGAGPENNLSLDLNNTERWVKTVDWSKVVGWGLYGGEPSIELELYQKFYNLLPEDLPKFIITNGTWSNRVEDLREFLGWCAGKVHIIVSGTPEHRANQDTQIINIMVMEYPKGVTYKPLDEEIHPMGRAAVDNWHCSKKCIWHEQVMRLGVFPTGDIILQNCDGVYPVIGHIETHTFDMAFEAGRKVREYGCSKGQGQLNINDLLEIYNRTDKK